MATLPSIRENPKYLQSLIERCRTPGQRLRLQALLLLREHPEIPLESLAVRLGRSSRTLHRWFDDYKKNGIEAFTADRRKDNHILSESQLQELYAKLSREEFETVKEISRWLSRRFGLTMSEAGIRGALKRLRARHVWTVEPVSSPETLAVALQHELLELMNRLPIAGDGRMWEMEAREILHRSLADVDRVTIVLNPACDILNPEEYRSVQTVAWESGGVASDVAVVPHRGEDHLERLLKVFREQGHHVERYQLPPDHRHYSYRGAYVGSVLLWREKEKKRISKETLRVLDLLEPLMLHSMLYALISHTFANPLERVLIQGLSDLINDADLTPTELKVISYRLFGLTYREIAEQLGVSIDAIKKPVQRVYEKTGTKSHSQFTRKYFLFRFGHLFKTQRT